MYVTAGGVPDRVPCAGCVTTVYAVIVSPSTTSLPVRVMDFAMSSAVVTACAFATGASFTGVIVMLTVASAEVSGTASSSVTVKVNESGPL